MAPLSIGSDAAGSVRIPASFCTISSIKVSFQAFVKFTVKSKPTVSVVPHAPASPFGTMANVGPMALTIRDAALFLDVIGQPHPWDPLSSYPTDKKRKFSSELNEGVKGLRIALNFSLSPYCDPKVEQSIRKAAKVFEEMGATVEEIEQLPYQNDSTLDVYGSFKTLWCTGGATVISKRIQPNYEHLVDENLRDVAQKGRQFTSVDLMSAEMTRTTMTASMNQHFFTKYDVLITPTLPITPFSAELETTPDELVIDKLCGGSVGKSPFFDKEFDRKRWWLFCAYTFPMNMMKLPAASVPSDDFIGLHIVGPTHGESLVLRVANAFQEHTNHVPQIADYE